MTNLDIVRGIGDFDIKVKCNKILLENMNSVFISRQMKEILIWLKLYFSLTLRFFSHYINKTYFLRLFPLPRIIYQPQSKLQARKNSQKLLHLNMELAIETKSRSLIWIGKFIYYSKTRKSKDISLLSNAWQP